MSLVIWFVDRLLCSYQKLEVLKEDLKKKKSSIIIGHRKYNEGFRDRGLSFIITILYHTQE